jgi:prophage regulatory protein
MRSSTLLPGLAPAPAEETIRLYRLPEVMQMTGLARSTIYKVMALGKFPKQIHLTDQCVAWRRADIEVWITTRATHCNAPTSHGSS